MCEARVPILRVTYLVFQLFFYPRVVARKLVCVCGKPFAHGPVFCMFIALACTGLFQPLPSVGNYHIPPRFFFSIPFL